MSEHMYGISQQYKPTQFVTSNRVLIKIGGVKNIKNRSAAEFLVQGINLQFNRPTTPLFEIGTNNAYVAPGRPMGQMQIQRIIGAKRITDVLGKVGQGLWTTNVSDGDAESRTITLAELILPGVAGEVADAAFDTFDVPTVGLVYILTGCTIENYDFSTSASGLLCQEGVSIRFLDLQFGGQDLGRVIEQAVAGTISTVGAVTTALG